MQLGVVDPVVSVAYRFTLASVLLLIWCKAFNLNMRFSRKQHVFMATQGQFSGTVSLTAPGKTS